MHIEQLQEQHSRIINLIAHFRTRMHEIDLAADATEVFALLSELEKRLHEHLRLEDEWLYPRLLVCNDAAVRRLAQRYVNDMGGIAKMFAAYVQRWDSPEKISAAAADFVGETSALFMAIRLRIDREDKNLYPLCARLTANAESQPPS